MEARLFERQLCLDGEMGVVIITPKHMLITDFRNLCIARDCSILKVPRLHSASN